MISLSFSFRFLFLSLDHFCIFFLILNAISIFILFFFSFTFIISYSIFDFVVFARMISQIEQARVIRRFCFIDNSIIAVNSSIYIDIILIIIINFSLSNSNKMNFLNQILKSIKLKNKELRLKRNIIKKNKEKMKNSS